MSALVIQHWFLELAGNAEGVLIVFTEERAFLGADKLLEIVEDSVVDGICGSHLQSHVLFNPSFPDPH